MMGFAALYPSYVLQVINRRGEVVQGRQGRQGRQGAISAAHCAEWMPERSAGYGAARLTRPTGLPTARRNAGIDRRFPQDCE